jgi:signal transduction histidine kinase
MASYSAQASDCPPLTIASTALLAMIDHHDAELVFDDDAASGLEPYLPPGTRSHVAVLFYALDQPLFMIVAASKCALQRFQAPTLAMLRSMGVILRARAIQARVAEADAEKTAFLSSISHELRTPMHSLMTGLELAEAALDDRDWQDCREIMRAVQSSGSTLRGILNDVLDFDKFDKATSGNAHPLEQVDLVEKAGAAALVCWAQNDSTRTGASITLEYEERDWRASIDKAGYDRWASFSTPAYRRSD